MSELIALESVVLVTLVMFAVLRIASDVRKIRKHVEMIAPAPWPSTTKAPHPLGATTFVPPPIRTPDPAR